jgi:hypothetical protein
MIELEYLKRSKEEIGEFVELFNSFGEKTFYSIINHMQKSMLFMADSLAGRHIDLLTEYPFIKEKIFPFFGNSFFETYFLLNNMANKEIKILSNDRIIVTGKQPYNLNKDYFKELAAINIGYFNALYSRVENNEL